MIEQIRSTTSQATANRKMLFSLPIIVGRSIFRPTSDLGFHEEKNEVIPSRRTGKDSWRFEMESFLYHFLWIYIPYTDCDTAVVLFNREVQMVVTNSSDCCLNA